MYKKLWKKKEAAQYYKDNMFSNQVIGLNLVILLKRKLIIKLYLENIILYLVGSVSFYLTTVYNITYLNV